MKNTIQVANIRTLLFQIGAPLEMKENSEYSDSWKNDQLKLNQVEWKSLTESPLSAPHLASSSFPFNTTVCSFILSSSREKAKSFFPRFSFPLGFSFSRYLRRSASDIRERKSLEQKLFPLRFLPSLALLSKPIVPNEGSFRWRKQKDLE